MKTILKSPALHPSLQREPIKLKRIDWAKFEDHNYRGVEDEISDRTNSIRLSGNANNCKLDNT